MKNNYPEFHDKIKAIPAFDAHTHIDAAHPTARGIGDILLYHMVISDLYAAGCPDGHRMSEQPDSGEVERRVTRALPYLYCIRNTNAFFAVRMILKELFDWEDPITSANWVALDEHIKKYGARQNRLKQVMAAANITKSNTELWRGHDGSLDGVFTYSLEWAFFTRAQWGRYDTALIELEYAWNHEEPCAPLPVTITPEMVNFGKKIRTVNDVDVAVEHFLDRVPFDRIMAIASHLSTDIHYRHVSRDDMQAAINRREQAGCGERDAYAGYIFNRFLKRYEQRGHEAVLQFSTAAEPLPFESGSTMRSEMPFELAAIIAEHPGIRFNLHIANMAANQTFCTLARELPNISLNGYWWHNFYPSFIKRVMSERLDMLPVNKTVGFFSDAYCMEWAYAKQRYIRHYTAELLHERMELGQFDEETALSVAESLFRNTACEIFSVRS